MIIKQDRENFHMLNLLDKFMMGHKGYIAGGCFKNIFNGEKIKDIDIFLMTRKNFIAPWNTSTVRQKDIQAITH